MKRIIISGGGTGGHIFPAISIANALKAKLPDAKFLFVGAVGRMEMERVPQAGYPIIGLPIMGFDRKNLLRNIKVLWCLLKSMLKARRIIKDFEPDIVVGVGGYASGAILKAANWAGIPTVLQEQNSFAGVTNKLLAKKAAKICVAYEGMERFFPKEKIIITGNPVRQNLVGAGRALPTKEAYDYFGFSPNKKTLLIVGGSLGARTINQSIAEALRVGAGRTLPLPDIQVIWQTGKIYYENIIKTCHCGLDPQSPVRIFDFLSRMDYAYAIADLVISRAGASSISELCLLGKPSILVPSPNVSEDHQTHNAMALVNKNAAVMVRDIEAKEELVDTALALINDNERLKELQTNILTLALPDSADIIAEEIIKIVVSGQWSVLSGKTNHLSLNTNNSIYFLGIGGIGMSALARYFKAKGYEVSGYDRTRTPLTEELEKEGIVIHYEEQEKPVADKNTQVIYTPAIPNDSIELNYFKNNGFELKKRAQVLGDITRNERGICIAGTHGKTTTSTMTAHLLYQSHVGCSAFLGGVSKNYESNLLLAPPAPPQGGESLTAAGKNNQPSGKVPLEGDLGGLDYVVIEADEYDRSFHQLSPYMALITAADADHLDIYGDKDEFRRSFEKFASLVKEGGYLIIKEGLDLNVRKGVAHNAPTIYTYGMNKGDFHAENIRIENGTITFDFVTPTETVKDIELGVPILINVENGVGAMALASLAGVQPDELRAGMKSFAGIRRRFDIQVKTDKLVYLDDYAHHPEELRASITSIKTLYPNRHICGIFQPHLYTRTRDFADGFAESLSLLDELILVDIYPARELPIEGVSSDMIFEKVRIKNKMRARKEDLLDILKDKELDILVTFGAGDIDAYVPKIKELLEERQ